MKEFELEMRLRNNLLKQRRLELGLKPGEVAARAGISYHLYLSYESLRASPMGSGSAGSLEPLVWKPSALKIAEFYGASPRELWPDLVLSVQSPRVVKRIEADRVLAASTLIAGALPAPSPEEDYERAELRQGLEVLVDDLPPLERDVVRRRYAMGPYDNEQRYSQIGQRHNLSREDARQIEARALRRLRERAADKSRQEKHPWQAK